MQGALKVNVNAHMSYSNTSRKALNIELSLQKDEKKKERTSYLVI